MHALFICFLSWRQVAVLRSLRNHVCEALAQIHASAAVLHLHLPQPQQGSLEHTESTPLFPHSSSSPYLSEEAERAQLFNRVQDSVSHAVQGVMQVTVAQRPQLKLPAQNP